ncbi:MAG: metal ABC transporter substrate-binding protein [Acidobacteriota bacterium]|nr:metal ABC transporter substrate-binding protein [Acidobacteriota bacterium]
MTGSAAPIRVVTTTSDLGSLAAMIGGDRVVVSSICKGYQDPHFVEAKPSYLLELRRADLLIAIGLELEVGWLPPLLTQSRNPKILGPSGYLDASAAAEILERPKEQVTRAMGDVHPFGNPHYWLNPENGRAIARAIAQKLEDLDAGGKPTFEKNLAAFEARLSEKEKEWAGRMGSYAGTEVITYHNSWPNFLKYFNLKAVGYIEPKPGIPPSPSHTLDIVNLALARKVPVILVEPYFDTKTPSFIASKTGANLLIFYPSVGGVPEIKDYFSIFDHDIDLFVKAMGTKK